MSGDLVSSDNFFKSTSSSYTDTTFDMKTRKELKDEYKQTKQRMGVYQVRNTESEYTLIGSSLNLDAAWNSTKFKLEIGQHPDAELQKQWKEFGPEHFVFEVLQELEHSDNPSVNPREELKELEKLTREELKNAHNG